MVVRKIKQSSTHPTLVKYAGIRALAKANDLQITAAALPAIEQLLLHMLERAFERTKASGRKKVKVIDI